MQLIYLKTRNYYALTAVASAMAGKVLAGKERRFYMSAIKKTPKFID
jgi:hypothetical protein